MQKLDVYEYYQGLMSEVLVSSQVDGTNPEVAFLNMILELLSESGEFDDYTIVEDGVDSGNRWRIDGYNISNHGTTLSYMISVFENDTQPSNLTKTNLTSIIKKVSNFLDFILEKDIYSQLEVASETFHAAEQIKLIFSNLSKIDIYIVSNKPASNRIGDFNIEKIRGCETNVHMWDLQRIFKLEASGREREEMLLDFSERPIPCLVTAESTDMTMSLLAVVDGETLFNTYDKWSSRLLEQNVRTYLQNRSKVNKGIRATIKDEPEKFFSYNNGLTTTAEDIEFTNPEKTHIKSLRNFQIVNGAQTTSSIYAAAINDKLDISKISVQMKLTVVQPDVVKDIVPNISKYANSQNKVSDADFFSNHPFHVDIETMSRRLLAPPKQGAKPLDTYWFYERARGQYLDTQAYMKPSERKRFQAQNPRSQLLTKTDLAKYENSWLQKPSSVSKGAQANFSEFAKFIDQQWNKDKSYFNEFYYKKCIVHAIIIKELEKTVARAIWYEGFRANIVTYCVAYFSWTFEMRSCYLNYDIIYKQQTAPKKLLECLLDIAEKVNNHLHSYSGNLTTYAKSAGAWASLKEKVIVYDSSSISEFLWSKDEYHKIQNQSKSIKKSDNKLSIEMKVHLLSKDDWMNIKKHLINMEIATEKYISLINKAMSIQGATYGMTQPQIKVLGKVIELYEKEKGLISTPV